MENNVIEIIQNVGFPIFIVLAMGFFIWQIYKQSVKREETLYMELSKSREVNEKALETLGLYANKLDVIQNDIKEIKNDIDVLTRDNK